MTAQRQAGNLGITWAKEMPATEVQTFINAVLVCRRSKGTPQKAIRVDPELWETAKQTTYRRDETISDVIRRSLQEYIRDHS
jgi:hypothetical protein